MAQSKTQEHLYPAAVADARYLMRRAFRMIDEESRKVGLEPLENQVLVQLRGAPDMTLSVTQLSVRVDIPITLVSRLVSQLQKRQLVTRSGTPSDKRVTLVQITRAGVDAAQKVAELSRARFAELKGELSAEQRQAALEVWGNNFSVETVTPRILPRISMS